MSTPVPRISIGLAVYNGERYLAAALDSLLLRPLARVVGAGRG